MQKEVIVASSVRTAIGDFGGALAAVSPTELGATVIREVLSRAHVEGEEVGHRDGDRGRADAVQGADRRDGG